MGDSGQIIFKISGLYYIYYNSMDSYPENLGQILIFLIKTCDTTNWETILNKYGKEENIYEKMFYIGEDDLKKVKNPLICEILKKSPMIDFLIKKLCPSLRRIEFLECKDTFNPRIFENEFIWRYLIDLDINVFGIYSKDKDIEYNFYNIPEEWIKPFSKY